MKPRKNGETAEQYIARLEAANSGLRANNADLSEQNKIFVRYGRIAASYAGMVLNAAAEIAGVADDPRTKAAARCFAELSSMPWNKAIAAPDTMPDFTAGRGEGGDAEMLLLSDLTHIGDFMASPMTFLDFCRGAKESDRELAWKAMARLYELATANLSSQARAAMGLEDVEPFTPPPVTTVDDAAVLVRDLWWEICDVLSDVEMSRVMLRLDLRASMYDTAFTRIAGIMRAAQAALPEPQPRPWADDGSIPS